MDFALDAEQRLLVDAVAAFVARTSSVSRARRLREDALGFDRATWRTMGELGWLALPFDSSIGGLGGSVFEACLVLEQLGTGIAPEPYLASVLLAGQVLAAAGDDAQRAAYLAPMMAGETTLALAHRPSRRGAPCDVFATSLHGDYVLRGEARSVDNGHAADAVVVEATLEGRSAAFVVESGDPGVLKTPFATLDGRRAARVRFDDVRVPAARRLAHADVDETLARAIDVATAGAVAEGVGLARAMLRMTVEHLGTRRQFGRPLAAFQALAHRVADMRIELELLAANSTVASVRASGADGRARGRAVSAAKVQLHHGGGFVARQSIQLHGGIGVTDEHDLGLFVKRHLALEALFGGVEDHLARYAALVDA